MNKFYIKLIIIFVLTLILLSGGYFIFRGGINNSADKITGSSIPNILFFTNPVTDFTGKVDKISENIVWVSGKYFITPPPTPPNAPTLIPGQAITVPPLPPSKTITYKIKIEPFTVINKPDSPISYLFKKITPTPSPKLTVKDIHAGQIVAISSASDLRTLKTDEFDAYSVKLPPIVNAISGKIADIHINDGIIILKAMPPVQPGSIEPTPKEQKEAEYAISVTDDTEISRMGKPETPKVGTTPKPAQPVKYEISDLKKDILITIYTDSDVIENQKLKALRIEPPIDLVPIPKSPTIPPTASPKK